MKVISHKNLPANLPIFSTVVTWILYKQELVGDIVLGGICLLLFLKWINELIKVFKQDYTDIF
jgi:hypothetical protein